MYSWKGRSIGREIRWVMARGLWGEDRLHRVLREFGGNKNVLYLVCDGYMTIYLSKLIQLYIFQEYIMSQ